MNIKEKCRVKTVFMKHMAILLTVIMILSLTPVAVFAEGGSGTGKVLYEENFEDGEALDWVLGAGYSVWDDVTNGNKVLRFKTGSSAMSIYGGLSFSGSYKYNISVFSPGGGGNRVLLIFNYEKNETYENYYALELQPGSSRLISLFKMNNGTRYNLQTISGTNFKANTWIDYEIKYQAGGYITITDKKTGEDPSILFDVVDMTFTSGNIGVGIDNSSYVLFDNIVVSEILVDKEELQSSISVAEEVYGEAVPGTEPGQYPLEAMIVLDEAISVAQAVYDDEAATQVVVDQTVTDLDSAVTTFIAQLIPEGPVDRTALQSALSVAENVYNLAVPGTAVGQYPIDAVGALDEAIGAAQAIYDDEEAIQADVDLAVVELQAAVSTFEAQVIKLGNKTALESAITEAEEVYAEAVQGTDLGQYPAVAMDALQGAINSANAVWDDDVATEGEVNAAVAALDAAIDNFATYLIKSFSENFNNSKAEGWTLPLPATITGRTNLRINDYNSDNIHLAVFENQTFLAPFTYKARMRCYSSGGNKKLMVFNYLNSDNYYWVEIVPKLNNDELNVVLLKKKVAGQVTELGKYIGYDVRSKWAGFEINYDADGYITVAGTVGTEKTTLISNVQDASLTHGKIGIGIQNNSADFDDIIVKVHENDMSQLTATIDNAQLIHTGAIVGTKPGQYQASVKTTFLNAINAAKAVRDNEIALQEEIDAAELALEAAVNTFIANANSPEDINGDGVLNAGDLAIVASYNGLNSSSPNWDAVKYADVDGNGEINTLDMKLVVDKIVE